MTCIVKRGRRPLTSRHGRHVCSERTRGRAPSRSRTRRGLPRLLSRPFGANKAYTGRDKPMAMTLLTRRAALVALAGTTFPVAGGNRAFAQPKPTLDRIAKMVV